MLTIKEYTGATYFAGKDKFPRNDYIRFEWSTGYLDMKKYHYEKLSKKKRSIIFSVQ